MAWPLQKSTCETRHQVVTTLLAKRSDVDELAAHLRRSCI